MGYDAISTAFIGFACLLGTYHNVFALHQTQLGSTNKQPHPNASLNL